MILVDTGPLIALIDAGQGEAHIRCVQAYQGLTGIMVTTWPCFTESMYFMSKLKGWRGQQILWEFLARKALVIHFADKTELNRMKFLMEKY